METKLQELMNKWHLSVTQVLEEFHKEGCLNEKGHIFVTPFGEAEIRSHKQKYFLKLTEGYENDNN